jgi:hypothetical protein
MYLCNTINDQFESKSLITKIKLYEILEKPVPENSSDVWTTTREHETAKTETAMCFSHYCGDIKWNYVLIPNHRNEWWGHGESYEQNYIPNRNFNDYTHRKVKLEHLQKYKEKGIMEHIKIWIMSRGH